jgi:hypothetical protein
MIVRAVRAIKIAMAGPGSLRVGGQLFLTPQRTLLPSSMANSHLARKLTPAPARCAAALFLVSKAI